MDPTPQSLTDDPAHPHALIAAGDLCVECALGLCLVGSEDEFHSARTQSGVETNASGRRCGFCLGVLADHQQIATAILDRILEQGLEYDSPVFRMELMLPRAIMYRRQLFLSQYKHLDINLGYEVRKAFAMLTTPIFEAALGKRHTDDGALHFIVETAHDADKEIPGKPPRPPGGPSGREIKRQKKANKPKTQTREEAFDRAIDGVAAVTFPLPPVTTSVRIVQHLVRRDPVYVGGRYLKLARHVAQSKWLIDGKPKTPLSVSECAGDRLQALARADEALLIAAGREDADVRMLGAGRPFFIELRNARCIDFDPIPVAEEINREFAGVVQVSRMRWVTKAETKLVKVGEELKAKQYSCLVYAAGDVDATRIAEISAMKNFTVEQWTPTRVLHRRPNAMRPKTIHWIRVTALENNFYRVDLETQAGTYVKEFITGDLGRSSPSLRSLLGVPTDILELDVTNVDLDWPPRTEEKQA